MLDRKMKRLTSCEAAALQQKSPQFYPSDRHGSGPKFEKGAGNWRSANHLGIIWIFRQSWLNSYSICKGLGRNHLN